MPSAEYDGQMYMVYWEHYEVKPDYTSLALGPEPLWLLCVSRQVYCEAAPLVVSNVHFSFYEPLVLLGALTAQKRVSAEPQFRIPKLM